ncbi:MAG: hypothetical protein AB1626_05215, partial [Candidatus Micrarchaeota archaeon]
REKPVGGLREAREALRPEKEEGKEEEKKEEEKPGGAVVGMGGGRKPPGEEAAKEKREKGLSWISPKGLWSTPSSSRWLIIGAIIVFIIFLLMLAFP